MKKFVIVVLILLYGTFVPVTFAHVLKTSGSIGAVIHITPDDDPASRVTTDFYFDFKDKNNLFIPDMCDCTGVIVQNGKEIYTSPLTADTTNSSAAYFSYTFPQKGIYIVKVLGKPQSGNSFEKFELSWDIRVEKDGKQTDTNTSNQQNGAIEWTTTHLLHLGVGVIILLLAVVAIIKKRKSER